MFQAQSGVLTIAYVLTSDGRDQFADMALVSMLSVRISNPSCRIVLLCDAESATAIKSAKHRVREVCDEIMPVETPPGTPTFRNRWIKTQLCKFIPGSVLYLDVDTLVREDVSALSKIVTNIGFVANHNGSVAKEQLWNEDLQYLQLNGWNPHLPFYPNGGVIFYHQTPSTTRLFEKWHELWLEDFQNTKRGRDQPALYEALAQSSIEYTELPLKYNFQFALPNFPLDRMAILHFYIHQYSGIENVYGKLFNVVNHVSLNRLKKLVKNAIADPYGWPSRDWLSRFILHLESRKLIQLTPVHKLWLIGSRAGAVRMFLGRFRKGLSCG
jgi:lipopolysaccharide biosynthesis glycosyltransferase